MKIGTILGVFVIGIAVLETVSLTSTLNADERDQVGTTSAGSSFGRFDNATSGVNIRASKLIGMNIQNSQGESVGQVNDIVLDGNQGTIRYAAVTYGGFLGVGNKMFAVPFEAFKIRSNPNQSNSYILVLDVTKSQLDGSVGFDENQWPDFADKKIVLDLDRRYKVERRFRDRDIRVDVDRNGVDIDVDKQRTTPK